MAALREMRSTVWLGSPSRLVLTERFSCDQFSSPRHICTYPINERHVLKGPQTNSFKIASKFRLFEIYPAHSPLPHEPTVEFWFQYLPTLTSCRLTCPAGLFDDSDSGFLISSSVYQNLYILCLVLPLWL